MPQDERKIGGLSVVVEDGRHVPKKHTCDPLCEICIMKGNG